MRLVGIMPVRNEAWVLRASLRVALEWCDAVVVLIHESTDESEEIAIGLGVEHYPRVVVIGADGDWREMEHRQGLLESARALDASHIAMIDADEILTGNLWRLTKELAETLPPHVMLELPGYNLRGSLSRFHCTGIWANRWFATCFQNLPELNWSGDRFHHRAPMGAQWRTFRPIQQGEGGVLHLWGASERRLVAKHALYKITERLRWPAKDSETINQQYNLAIREPEFQPWRYAAVPPGWLPSDMAALIDVDAEPWQEAECRRLVAQHGASAFRGLDLFGVA